MALFPTPNLLVPMRLDQYLAECGSLSSRSEAKRLISEGAVYIDDKQITKPAFDVSGLEDRIFVDMSRREYVSRGGIKLAGAIRGFGIDCSGKSCLDIGASSGGFTDCLLKNGAARVIAVDSGEGQLVASIANDARVISKEHFNARYMTGDDLDYMPELVVMDVSFISATYIIPAISTVTESGAEFICLIKPQFEVGRAGLGKGGIVKDDRLRAEAVDKVVACCREYGFVLKEIITSPIKGGDGNIEFLAYFIKE